MNQRMYAIYDVKAETYSQPFFHWQDGQAIRAFTDAANNKETQIGLHPEDYTLFFMAIWDDQTGELTPHPPLSLGTGLQFTQTPQIE